MEGNSGSSQKCRECHRKAKPGRGMCHQHLTLFNMRAHRGKMEKALEANPQDIIAQIALREMDKRINRIAGKIKSDTRSVLHAAKQAGKPAKQEGMCKYKNCKFRAMPNCTTCLAHDAKIGRPTTGDEK